MPGRTIFAGRRPRGGLWNSRAGLDVRPVGRLGRCDPRGRRSPGATARDALRPRTPTGTGRCHRCGRQLDGSPQHEPRQGAGTRTCDGWSCGPDAVGRLRTGPARFGRYVDGDQRACPSGHRRGSPRRRVVDCRRPGSRSADRRQHGWRHNFFGRRGTGTIFGLGADAARQSNGPKNEPLPGGL